MEDFIIPRYSDFEEIQLSIQDAETVHCGGNQYWFTKKMHKLSGCGPVAAANITAYLAKLQPDKYEKLYPYEGVITKKDYTEHLHEVRKYVKPGPFGLTSVTQFVDNVQAFCKSKGITLTPHILEKNATMHEAIDFISEALHEKLPVAILVLKHPVKELDDYTWHWMTILDLKLDYENKKHYISVSTYGDLHKIDLDLLWNRRRPTDIIRLAYFL